MNGGGMIDREYGLGRKRTDLFVRWPYGDGQAQKVVIELKLLRKGPAAAIKQGVAQTAEYADLCGAEEAHLIVFDRRPLEKISWSKKIFVRKVKSEDRTITLWGC
jgi:hypothetical protein